MIPMKASDKQDQLSKCEQLGKAFGVPRTTWGSRQIHANQEALVHKLSTLETPPTKAKRAAQKTIKTMVIAQLTTVPAFRCLGFMQVLFQMMSSGMTSIPVLTCLRDLSLLKTRAKTWASC
jgi:hypothetical protein